MKKILSIVTSMVLMMLLIPASVLAAPQITLSLPGSAQFIQGTLNPVVATVTSAGANVTSAEFQTVFGEPSGVFTGQRILVQIANLTPAPRSGAATANDTIPVPAGFPPAAVAAFSISGAVVSVNATTGEWRIGTPAAVVYESASTSFLGLPTVGSNVKISAVRTQEPGPLVARSIARTSENASPASPPTRGLSFVLNGTVESVRPSVQSPGIKMGEVWTVAGVPIQVDNPNVPAIIDQGLAQGSSVTVQFGPNLPIENALNTAIEIRPQVPIAIPAPLHPAPTANTETSPLGVPAGSTRLTVVSGVVASVNATGPGEWRIGNPPVSVYQSAATAISARQPVVGDEVLVIGKRALAAGPIVAENITFQVAGPLPAVPAVVSKTFLLNGTVSAAGAATWTVGGSTFAVNSPSVLPVIGVGLTAGSAVTVEFSFFGPPPPDENLWKPLAQTSTPNMWSGNLTPPATTTNRTGFLFVRATDNQTQTSVVQMPASLLVTAPPAAPPPTPPVIVGGGGGGGGAAPPPVTVVASGLTGTAPVVDAVTGITQAVSRLATADNKVSISIPSGTTMRTASGSALSTISAAPTTAPAPPPANTNLIGAPYDFGPEGANFSPPIAVSLAYTLPLPEGVTEDSLVIVLWDGSKWVEQPSTVNKTTKTVTAQVAHFSKYALIGKVVPPTPTPTPPPSTTPATPVTPPATTPPTPPPTTPATPVTPPATTPPTTTPAPATPVPEVPSAQGVNWLLIIGIAAVVLAALTVLLLRRKKASA